MSVFDGKVFGISYTVLCSEEQERPVRRQRDLGQHTCGRVQPLGLVLRTWCTSALTEVALLTRQHS